MSEIQKCQSNKPFPLLSCLWSECFYGNNRRLPRTLLFLHQSCPTPTLLVELSIIEYSGPLRTTGERASLKSGGFMNLSLLLSIIFHNSTHTHAHTRPCNLQTGFYCKPRRYQGGKEFCFHFLENSPKWSASPTSLQKEKEVRFTPFNSQAVAMESSRHQHASGGMGVGRGERLRQQWNQKRGK